jgi:predicted AAA+ superfamily ATPase
MIFRRLLEFKLLLWKNKENRKPLILRGARQVGKTTLVDHFSKNFHNYIKLNMERPEDSKYFDSGKSSKQTIEQIFFEKELTLTDGETLLFIDEIQELPFLIKQLRYFHEDYPDLHLIVAGSLLEFELHGVDSYPVGRVEELCIHPLNFEEFLMALGEDSALKQFNHVPLNEFAFDKLNELFKTYTIIGGMPEVVRHYVTNRSMVGLNEVYSSIWDTYKSDILKYAKNRPQAQILSHIIQTAPLMKDRVVFNNFGGSDYKSREVGEALRSLDIARIIFLVYPTTETSVPFGSNLERRPRLQLLDTGLLNYASNLQIELLEMRDLSSYYRGFIANHVATQEMMALHTNHFYRPLFWVREKANSNAELDLTYQWKNTLIPIEVKSGNKGSLKSMNEFMQQSTNTVGVRLLNNYTKKEIIALNNGKNYTLINLPLFLISKIDLYLEYYNA